MNATGCVFHDLWQNHPMAVSIHQHITFIYTRDLNRSADFYEGVLGLRLAREQAGCRIYHLAGGSYLGVCDLPHRAVVTDGVIITLVTDEVDEWCERLRAHGVPLEKDPADSPQYRIYHAFVRDPNGYLIEIQRFWEPLP